MGFSYEGHAGAAQAGEDIVCAALSMLGINTVNAIEKLALPDGGYEDASDPEKGYISIRIKEPCHDSDLLIEAMIMGVNYLTEAYPQYVRLKRKGGVTDDRI